MDIIERIESRIAAKRLLDHPFYAAWNKGELTRAALRKYAEQYYHWVAAFPTWLSAAHANAPNLAMRQEILANLADEELGPDNHPELWLRFCDALGLDRDDVRNADLLPETRDAIATMRQVSRAEPAVAALAALYSYESQQPEVMRTKLDGLRTMYDVHDGLEYFEVHESVDVAHSAAERAMVASHAAGSEDAIDAAASAALLAIYRLLDGIERVRTVH